MNTDEHLLTLLMEEAAEVVKDASKSLRFGVGDRYDLGPSNIERLIDELNDLMAVVELLVHQGILPPTWIDKEKQRRKRNKVHNFMEYAKGVGSLQ